MNEYDQLKLLEKKQKELKNKIKKSNFINNMAGSSKIIDHPESVAVERKKTK